MSLLICLPVSGASVSPPTCNVIGSCPLIALSHWPEKMCSRASATRETSLEVSNVRADAAGRAAAPCAARGESGGRSHLAADIRRTCALVFGLRAVWAFSFSPVSGGFIYFILFIYFCCWRRLRFCPQRTVDEDPVVGSFMAKRPHSACPAWLRLLHRPPRDRYGF